MDEAARRAGPEDLARLGELVAEAAGTTRSLRGGSGLVAAFDEAVSDAGGLGAYVTGGRRVALVGTYHDHVVGFAVAETTDAPGSARVLGLWVEPGAREVGVGSALLQATMSWAAEHEALGLDVPALPGDRHTKNLLERSSFRARLVVLHRSFEQGAPNEAFSAPR
ncbi:MAG: acetyltransferase family protein [Acidimicrobiaceae bacterium]|nr:acetyltransferase family protein [Acidimicrobiaceae bacterium]